MRISDWSSDVCSSDLADLLAGIVDPVGDHRPAVIAPGLRDVDLVAAARAMLVQPDGAGLRADRHALDVAMAVGPDFRLRAGAADEGIVGRHAAVAGDRKSVV